MDPHHRNGYTPRRCRTLQEQPSARTAVTVPALLCSAASGPGDRRRHPGRSLAPLERRTAGFAVTGQLWAGIRVVHRDRPLRAITIMYVATNCLDNGLVVMLIPLWAREGGHSAALAGLVLSAAGGAAVCSALAAAWLGAQLPRKTAYLTGVIISGPTRILVLALDCPPAVVIAVYTIAGIGSGIFNPVVRTVMAEVAPAGLRGRVYALIDAISWISIPFGGLLAAATVSAAGLTGTLWAFGIAYLLAVLHPTRRVTWQPMRSAPAAIPAPRRSPDPGATGRDRSPQWSVP
jgi:MFS family permease